MPVAACADVPITPGVAVFNFVEFSGVYPEFSLANPAACGMNFSLSTLLLSNCCGSAVCDPNVRLSLLYMLCAHITYLNTPCGANNNQPPGIVGRINSASEGSVSVSAEMPGVTASSAYFMQTKYGAQFWQSTASLRTMHYVSPQVCNDAPFGDSFTGYGYCNGGW